MLHKSHFPDVPPSDRAAIADALYRFGAGQDLRDRPLFIAFAADASLDFTAVAAKLGVDHPRFEGRQPSPTRSWRRPSLSIPRTPSPMAGDRLRWRECERVRSDRGAASPRSDHSRHLLLKNRLSVNLRGKGSVG